MKLTLEKKETCVIDTSIERKRINRAFRSKHHKTTHKKLHKLMDLIESCEWKKAEKEIDGNWWQGRDSKEECPRLEFVGLINKNSSGDWLSYMDLIYILANKGDMYKIISKEVTV